MKARVLAGAIALVACFPSTAGTIILMKESGTTSSQPTFETLLVDFQVKPGTSDRDAEGRLGAVLRSDDWQLAVSDGPPCVRTKEAAQRHGAWVKRKVAENEVPVQLKKIVYNCVRGERKKL